MAKLETLTQRLSYIVGENMAKQMHADGVDIDADALADAVKDVFAGNPSALTLEDKEKVVEEMQKLSQAADNEEKSCCSGNSNCCD